MGKTLLTPQDTQHSLLGPYHIRKKRFKLKREERERDMKKKNQPATVRVAPDTSAPPKDRKSANAEIAS